MNKVSLIAIAPFESGCLPLPMIARVHSATVLGVEAQPVLVEVSAGEPGDPRLVLVGLPDAAVREAQDRVTAALVNSGFERPQTRTTINLAPGDLRKEGSYLDLPIALGLLAATGQLPGDTLQDCLIVGELGLDGRLAPVRGAIAMALRARAMGLRRLILPPSCAAEAALLEGIEVHAPKNLDEAYRFLRGEESLEVVRASAKGETDASLEQEPDFAEVCGQQAVRRAVEVAVAGGHNLLMVGPPGSGKSMIARRIAGILPAASRQEQLEILNIHSMANCKRPKGHHCVSRPFRAPHHTISDVGLLGGGSVPGPGEITLSHRGVLFLDELPEFRRSTLEVLRQPLEDGEVTIARSAARVTLPSHFMLVAAMNPCPCGHLGSREGRCRCRPAQVERYRSRISGPLLDRMDLQIEAPAVDVEELQRKGRGEPSSHMRARIEVARERQEERLQGEAGRTNARMSRRALEQTCELSDADAGLLRRAMKKLKLSARAHDRILRVARTIADLADSKRIESDHLLEAIHYRQLDRALFE